MENLLSLSYAPNTINLYDRVIDSFVEYMREFEEEVELDALSPSYFTGFLFHINKITEKRKGKQLSKSSKSLYLRAIKSFFDYIESTNNEQFVFSKMFKKIVIADSSKPEDKIKHFEDDDLFKILNQLEKNKKEANSDTKFYLSMRNALLFKILVYAGLRASEALGLKVKDFTENESVYTIKIFGKGQKEQKAYCPKDAISDELSFIVEHEDLKDADYVFQTINKKRLDRHNAYRALSTIYHRAGVESSGLHILRHTLAMRLMRADTPITTIQSVLRHSSIITTGIYAKADSKDKKESLERIWKKDSTTTV